MWQTRAVLTMLAHEVAELRRHPAVTTAEEFERVLSDARRKALRAVVIDWTALVGLLLLSDARGAFLTLGPRIETVFTVGLLAVAVHSGFRLAQLQKYRAIREAGAALTEPTADSES